MTPKPSFFAIMAALGASLLVAQSKAAEPSYTPPGTNWVVGSDELIRIALTNNLSILISQLQPEMDQYALNGIYGAYQPNLTLDATHAYNSSPGGYVNQAGIYYASTVNQINSYTPGLAGFAPWGLSYNVTGPLQEDNQVGEPDIYNSYPNIQLSQPLLKNFWIDNTRYQISLSRSTLKIDQLALMLQIMTVVNNMKAAYYTLISDRKLVEVQQEAVALAEETMHEDEQRVKAGALAPLDEKQAESQAANARSDLFTAQTTLAAQENVIKSLLGVRRGRWSGTPPMPAEQLVAVPENPDVRECWRIALEKRPDMQQAKLRAEAQHMLIKLDFNQLFPELDLVGSYGRNATELTFGGNLETVRQGTFPFYSYGVAMTIPLGNSAARNKYRSDKAGLQQLQLQIKQVELTVIPTIDNDVTKLRTDLLKVDSSRKARIYAEEALEAEQTKLRRGSSTSFVVLQLQQTLTARRSDEIQALANYNIDLDQLAFDEGTILERNHIDLRVR